MRIAVSGVPVASALAELMKLFQAQPPGFSCRFDGHITDGHISVSLEDLKVGVELVGAGAQGGDRLNEDGICADSEATERAQPDGASGDAESIDKGIDELAYYRQQETMAARYKPYFFGKYNTQEEFDAAAMRGENPGDPRFDGARERIAQMKKNAELGAEQERREKVFRRILSTHGQVFIDRLNSEIADVWEKFQPVYPNNAGGGRKGDPRPMPTLAYQGYRVWINVNNPKGTKKVVKTPLSIGHFGGEHELVWNYFEWSAQVVPRLEIVINQMENDLQKTPPA